MIKFTEEQLVKLPKWAKEKIKRLQHEIDALNEDLLAYTDNPETKVSYDTLNTGKGTYTRHNLPSNATIEFHVGNSKFESISAQATLDGNVRISANGRRLLVLPSAANSIYVQTDW